MVKIVGGVGDDRRPLGVRRRQAVPAGREDAEFAALRASFPASPAMVAGANFPGRRIKSFLHASLAQEPARSAPGDRTA